MITNSITERIGIHRVALCFLEKYGWIEREQIIADFGIDTQVEIVENEKPTGLLYCIQVKSGKSYIKKSNEFISYYPEEKHVEYWLNHTLPVLLILCDLEENKSYWEFVNSKTVIKTAKHWKIEIPLVNILENEESISKIKSYYFNNDNFTIMESGIDTSHALSRRISMKIILKQNISKVVIEEQIPQLVEGLKKSDYYRSKMVEDYFKNAPADCVWIWFYRNFEQYKNGLPFCTAYWNDPKSTSQTSLNPTDKEIKNGIFINYSNVEISNDFLNKRLSKGKYLKIVDKYLSSTDKIFKDIITIYEEYKVNKSINYLKIKILEHQKEHDELLPKEYRQNFPPLECSDLDQIVSKINAAINNIFIILNNNERSEENIIQCLKMCIKDYRKNIDPVKYERKKVI